MDPAQSSVRFAVGTGCARGRAPLCELSVRAEAEILLGKAWCPMWFTVVCSQQTACGAICCCSCTDSVGWPLLLWAPQFASHAQVGIVSENNRLPGLPPQLRRRFPLRLSIRWRV